MRLRTSRTCQAAVRRRFTIGFSAGDLWAPRSLAMVMPQVLGAGKLAFTIAQKA
jgi:hypothetical protein